MTQRKISPVTQAFQDLKHFSSCMEERKQDMIFSWEFKYEKVKSRQLVGNMKEKFCYPFLLQSFLLQKFLTGRMEKKEYTFECTFGFKHSNDQ